jgi:hypothetical protein
MEHMSLTLTSINFFSGLRMERGLCDWPTEREVLKIQDFRCPFRFMCMLEAPKLRGYALRSPQHGRSIIRSNRLLPPGRNPSVAILAAFTICEMFLDGTRFFVPSRCFLLSAT